MSERQWTIDAQPDIKALVTLRTTADGGRRTPAFSGYRPTHEVREGYLADGQHTYLDYGFVFPGSSCFALIDFLAPERFPKCLWNGKVITLQEGPKIIGRAEIVEIYNDLLRAVQ